ncbi:MAG: AAA family ATPase [Armatimonadetes bacterium]|nr:AAA family ATPase [Armatimonadota bacterium]
MLKRLYIDNYKCFSNFEYRPGQVELLVGANGSGKSSLFSVLDSLRYVTIGTGIDGAFGGTSTRWDMRTLQTFEVDVQLALSDQPVTYRLELEHRADGQGACIGRESVSSGSVALYSFEHGEVRLAVDEAGTDWRTFPADNTQSPLARLGPGRGHGSVAGLLDWFLQLQVLQLDLLGVPRYPFTESASDAYLVCSGANFSGWLRTLFVERPQVRDLLRGTLAELWPGFADLRFERTGARAHRLVVDVAAEPGGQTWPYDFGELSHGERALLVMYTAYHATRAEPPGRVLCIDEPAAHLSLREVQPLIAACYDDFEEAGQQLLVASHHPEVINFLAPNKAVVLQRQEGGPVLPVRPFPTDVQGLLTPAEVVAEGLLDE